MTSAIDAPYRALFESTPDGIMIVDDTGHYVDLNEAMCRLLGGSREQLIGRHFRDFVLPERLEEALSAFAELPGNRTLSMELPVRALDGTIMNVEWRARAHFAPGLHFCIARDLSTRDDARRALRESDERYSAFVANSSEAIWRCEVEQPVLITLDADAQIDAFYKYGYLAECNDAMARMYGFRSSSDIVGLRLGEMVVRDKPENIEFLRAFIASGYRLLGAESQELDRDGNEKTFVNNFIGVIEDGAVVRAWGTQRDVTEKRRLDDERTALLARLEFLADVTAVLGSSLDYEQVLRSIAERSVPRFAEACFIDVLNAQGELERVAARGDAQSPRITVPLTAAGHALGTLTFAGRAFASEDVRLAEDIGRRAGMAIENARLYREVARANRAKDEFLAMLSHELRTPMTATLGWAGMLRTGGLTAEATRAAIEAIAQSTKAQARLIDDLLDVSRIVAGKLQLTTQRLRLADVIAEAIDTVRSAADAKHIELRVTAQDDVTLHGDAARLQQVFWNLLSNAVKFSPRQSLVDVELTSDGESARVVVRDRGEGISPDLLPYIFERFRQGETGASRRFGGLGLGLSIARNLVELHGGTLTAVSAGAGQGSEFTVTLPLR